MYITYMYVLVPQMSVNHHMSTGNWTWLVASAFIH